MSGKIFDNSANKPSETQVGANQPEAKAYTGTDKDAQKLAELGTLALVGHYQSEQQMLAEIHRLEKDPAHMQVVARDLNRINATKDGLPVHASVETDPKGNVVSLNFKSSKELENVVYGNEAKYEKCFAENEPTSVVGQLSQEAIARNLEFARNRCKFLDVAATSATPIAFSHKFDVLNPGEQKSLNDMRGAIETGDETAIAAAMKPYFGQNSRDFLRIAHTDNVTSPYSYTVDGNKLDSVYYPKSSGGFMNIKSN